MSNDEQGRPSESEQATRSAEGVPTGSPGDAALPHKHLGDFELLHDIDRGGMSLVSDVRQIPLKRRVALMVLPPGPGMMDQAVGDPSLPRPSGRG